MRGRSPQWAVVLAAIALCGCTAVQSNSQRLADAERDLRTRPMDAGLRAEAYGLYHDVLSRAPTHGEAVRAHFGLGMIALLDLAQAAASLANSPAATGSTTSLPPAERLVPVVDAAVHAILQDGIVDHWKIVAAESDFRFTFAANSLVLDFGGGKPIDLSGEWNLTEVRLIYGVLQVVIGTVEYVELYDHVVETVIRGALSGGKIPDLPASPAGIPSWLSKTVAALGFAQPPWLDAKFGVLSDRAKLPAVRARFSDGLHRIVDAFAYLQAEGGDHGNDVAPKDKFLGTLLGKVLDTGDSTVQLAINTIDALVHVADLLDVAGRLAASLDDAGKPFVFPDALWTLLAQLQPILAAKFQGTVNPVGLRVPAISLAALFDRPITDLKDRRQGVLPYYCAGQAERSVWGCAADGDFVGDSEQEPLTDANGNGVWDAGEGWADIGADGLVDANRDGVPDNPAARCTHQDRSGCQNRLQVWDEPIALRAGDPYLDPKSKPAALPPLAHASPFGTTEAANGIVDPLYLFFGNPSLNGLLVPMQEKQPGVFAAYPAAAYTNPDLQRLASSVIWIVQAAGIKKPAR